MLVWDRLCRWMLFNRLLVNLSFFYSFSLSCFFSSPFHFSIYASPGVRLYGWEKRLLFFLLYGHYFWAGGVSYLEGGLVCGLQHYDKNSIND